MADSAKPSDVVTTVNPVSSSQGMQPMDVEQGRGATAAGKRPAARGRNYAVFISIAVVVVLGALVGAFFVGKSVGEGGHQEAHWSYSGDGAPRYWGSLEPSYAICSSGQQQSPINIVSSDTTNSGNAPLQYNYTSFMSASKVARKPGHPGFEVVPDPAQADDRGLVVDGRVYVLKQFHFHAPSEHTIDGMAYPLEMHMVHADAAGNLAVLGFMFEGDTTTNNTFLEAFWPVMANDGTPTPNTNLEDMLSMNTTFASYYRYAGSLTTPPCSEGVKWFLARTHAKVSEKQVQQFINEFGRNARPVQRKFGRVIRSYDR